MPEEKRALGPVLLTIAGLVDKGVQLDFGATEQHITDGTLFEWLKHEQAEFNTPYMQGIGMSDLIPLIQEKSNMFSRTDQDLSRNGLSLLIGLLTEIALV